jgi:uncharacterized protein (DUF2062 family)
MPKKFIKRISPDHDTIRNHKHMRLFGKLLHDPNLWHLNRRSAAGAFAVGLFMAFVPLPTQMLFAAAAAILFRVNLPVSVALVWITNPITIPPMFYFAYKVGALILGHEAQTINFELSFECLADSVSDIWAPLLLGSLVCATLSSIIGFFTIHGLWRLRVINHLKKRKTRREQRGPQTQ